MYNTKVSVIVPVYNVEDYIEEALESLKKQTMTDIEFIVINDGSTDNSKEIIERITYDDTRFKIFNVENGGIGRAFNLGLSKASGEYIAEFESDDYVVPNAYEILYNTAKAHDVDVVRCNWTEFSTDKSIKRDILYQYPDKYNKKINLAEEKIFVQVYPWNAIYRKQMMDEKKIFWDESIKSYGDTGLFWKVNTAAKNIVFIKESLYFYRQDNPNSTVNNISTKVNYLLEQFKLIRKELITENNLDQYKKYFYKQMYEKYFWALEKMTHQRDEKVLSVMEKISKDFFIAFEEDKLDDIEFIYSSEMRQIANNYKKFYEKYLKTLYKVSVVIPIHNASSYLRNTLTMVCNQSLKEIEIILVENGSEDNSKEIIEEFSKRDARITAISIGSSNPGDARNRGVLLARGQYLQFLDADDEFANNMLQEAYYRAYDSSADIILFGMNEKELNGDVKLVPNKYLTVGGRLSGTEINLNDITPYLYDKMFYLDYVKQNMLVNLEQFVGEDAYFTYTAILGTTKIVSLNKVLLTRIVRQDGLMSTYGENYKDEFNLHQNMLNYIKIKAPEIIEAYRIKIINTVHWFMFENNRVRENFKEKFYKELKSTYISEFGLDLLNPQKFSTEAWQRDRIKRVQEIEDYDFETYSLIYKDKFNSSSNIIPNIEIQELRGKVIFGQDEILGVGTAINLFSIIILNEPTSNASAAINFIYMGDNKKIMRDTLLLSLLIKKSNSKLQPVVLQAEWEKGYSLLKENVYYTFVENVFSVWVGYTEKYAAIDYSFISITSREGRNHFSVVRNNSGFIVDKMSDIESKKLIVINSQEKKETNGKLRKITKKGAKKVRKLLK